MSALVGHARPDLPLAVEPALAILAAGTVVFAAVAYDLYRRWTAPGGDEWT